MNSPTKWRAGAAASFTISSTAKNNSALFLLRILTSIIALLLLYRITSRTQWHSLLMNAGYSGARSLCSKKPTVQPERFRSVVVKRNRKRRRAEAGHLDLNQSNLNLRKSSRLLLVSLQASLNLLVSPKISCLPLASLHASLNLHVR